MTNISYGQSTLKKVFYVINLHLKIKVHKSLCTKVWLGSKVRLNKKMFKKSNYFAKVK